MNNFLTYTIDTDLDNDGIFACVSAALADFDWRRGDSDAQGPYISGINKDKIRIKLWLGEEPVTMSVSFALAWPDLSYREVQTELVANQIKSKLLGEKLFRKITKQNHTPIATNEDEQHAAQAA